MSPRPDVDPEPPREPPPAPGLPTGYRQGIVTASTFLLGFGLTFARFWAFAPGAWRPANLLEGAPLLGGIVCLLWALFRALDPADEALAHYRVTRRLLLWGISLIFLAVVAALLSGEWTA